MVQALHWYRAGTFPPTLYERRIRCGTSPTAPPHRSHNCGDELYENKTNSHYKRKRFR